MDIKISLISVTETSSNILPVLQRSKMNYRAWSHRCWLVSYMTSEQVSKPDSFTVRVNFTVSQFLVVESMTCNEFFFFFNNLENILARRKCQFVLCTTVVHSRCSMLSLMEAFACLSLGAI